ncbi:MAG: DUF3472 domain-containing protein [Verrucomicrobia bacterium]|nr:DUF3472 domain-containing protein [Verrucomicrobiota bacterium]
MKSHRLLAILWLMVPALIAAESIGGKGPPRAARSVHLQWVAPECEAFYLEMTVEQSTPGSYFMACGWSGGYFGIQEQREGKTVAIFSVWDPTKGDDPKAVRPEDRVELLHEGAGVRIKRFGGEGTGGQCMTDFAWKTGETHRFLVRAEAHGANGEKTAYSGWLFDPRAKAWRQLVTFRTRNTGKLLRGLYSFVEDFRRDTKSVDDVRRAGFAHGWVRLPGGEWTPLETARFTASRAEWEARDNIDAGGGANGFWLATGGATVRKAELSAALPKVAATGKPPADLPGEVWASSAGATPR